MLLGFYPFVFSFVYATLCIFDSECSEDSKRLLFILKSVVLFVRKTYFLLVEILQIIRIIP